MNATEDKELRAAVVATVRCMVIKVGSRLLTDMEGASKQQRIEQLVAQIALLRQRGIQVILVTSGAIGAGIKLLGMKKRPTDLSRLQALAAVGQSRLMSHYERACEQHGFHCGQMLLSADDVKDRKRHLNIRNCLSALLANGVMPIINENDTVSVEEICFGDNDRLAALVGSMVRAELTVLLTTVDGLRLRENRQLGERIPIVREITPAIHKMAIGTDGNMFSTGGMASKILAAEITVASGENLWIVDGTDFSVIKRMMAAEDIGTLFVPTTGRMTGSKRFLAFFSNPAGSIRIDEGAVQAVRDRGKSLLPSGIVDIHGAFEKGDTVHIENPAGIKVGLGVSNYSARDLMRIKGLKSSEIASILGQQGYDEAIHRDNLVVLD